MAQDETFIVMTSKDAAELVRLRAKLDGLSGDGVTNTGKSISIVNRQKAERQREEQQNGFWAKITDSKVSEGWYAWTEQRRTATGFEDHPDARTGTTDGPDDEGDDENPPSYAIEAEEQSDTSRGAVPTGSFVWMWIGSDEDGLPQYTFSSSLEDCDGDEVVDLDAGSGADADTTTWSIDDGKSFKLTGPRIFEETIDTTSYIYMFVRLKTFDACGRIISVGAESRVTLLTIEDDCDS